MIVQINGGLGNQMFKYAFGRSVGIARNEPVVFHKEFSDTRHNRVFGLDAFCVTGEFVDHAEVLPWYLDPGKFDTGVYTAPSHMYYAGGWQSEKYFNEPVIRKEFEIREPISSSTHFVAEQILRGPSAFVHVRRGDFLWESESFQGVQPMDYYERAMQYIQERKEHVTFYVFSDDIEWCKKNFPAGCAMVGHNKEGKEHEDIYLMSLCDSAVIANSTFSWFGAWLGDNRKSKIVVAPEKWFANGQSSQDLVPKRWVRL